MMIRSASCRPSPVARKSGADKEALHLAAAFVQPAQRNAARGRLAGVRDQESVGRGILARKSRELGGEILKVQGDAKRCLILLEQLPNVWQVIGVGGTDQGQGALRLTAFSRIRRMDRIRRITALRNCNNVSLCLIQGINGLESGEWNVTGNRSLFQTRPIRRIRSR